MCVDNCQFGGIPVQIVADSKGRSLGRGLAALTLDQADFESRHLAVFVGRMGGRQDGRMGRDWQVEVAVDEGSRSRFSVGSRSVYR